MARTSCFSIVLSGPREESRCTFSRAVDALVGHVNGRFGRADYVPVHYVKRRLGEDEVKALYVAADVALIASVREGVNLWAMEYVACQGRDDSPPGVLVYSEFAGCASSFFWRGVDRKSLRRRGRGAAHNRALAASACAVAMRLVHRQAVGGLFFDALLRAGAGDEGDGATTETSCVREVREHVHGLLVGASTRAGTAVGSRADRGARYFTTS